MLEAECTLVALAAVLCGCSDRGVRGPNDNVRASSVRVERRAPAAASPTAAAPPVRAPLPPLEAPRTAIDLPIRGFLSAVVTVPLGTTEPRPVVVAAHGLGGGPQWVCPLWRDLAGAGVFVLCPRGQRVPGQADDVRPDDAAYRYPTWETLDAEIEAGLGALRARFPGRVADGPVLYSGFSQGANMGVAVMAKRPSVYRRAVLTEGGHRRWTPALARAYAAGGGERVLFACGRESCVQEATASAALLAAAGVEAKVVAAEHAGHVATGAVAEQTRGALDWLLRSEPRSARGEASESL